MDLREKYINEVTRSLVGHFDTNDIRIIQSLVTISLENYELSERSTEVGFVDNSTDQLLKIYAGTLLSEGKSKKTVKAYVNFLNRFERETNKPLIEINTMDIRIWLSKCQQGTTGLRTCDTYRSYLSSFYHFLTNEGILKENPVDRVGKIKYNKFTELEYSVEEIDMFRTAIKTQKERAVLEVLLATGLRATELCSLEIADVNMQKRNLIVRQGKGNKSRIVPISRLAIMHLRKYLETRTDDNPLLFVNRYNSAYNKNTLGTMVRKWGKATSVDNVHAHRFRKTFATDLFRRGMDIRSIQKLLGHSNINTTMIYLCITDDQIQLDYERSVA